MVGDDLHFFEGQRWSLGEQLEHFEEKLAEVELTTPLGIVIPRGPVRNEVVFDTVVLLDVVDEFDDDRIFGLVEVHVRRGERILRGE